VGGICGGNQAYVDTENGTTQSLPSTITNCYTTAIDALEVLTAEDAEYYDMDGRRQDDLREGMNIVKSGNKVIKVLIKQ